ncbi:hypothetical protein ACLB1T_06790 [Escherichia coli]
MAAMTALRSRLILTQTAEEEYLIPYFISAHPGTRDEDMVNLALRLKIGSGY